MESVTVPHSSVSYELSTKHVITGTVKVYSHEAEPAQLTAMRQVAEGQMVEMLRFALANGVRP